MAFERICRINSQPHSLRVLLSLLLLTLMMIPSTASAWWDTNWSFRKKITIDASPMAGALSQEPGRSPVLIRLHDGNFRFADAKEDGTDLRLVDSDDKTPLKFHIDMFDSLLGIGLIWVDVPAIRAGTTTDIYLYFGNTKAPNGSDPRGTYDTDTTLVYHFGDAAAPPRDETAYNNAGQPAVHSVDDPIIARGAHFAGPHVITLPPSPSLAIAPNVPFTWSAWIKTDAAQNSGVVFAKRDGANAFTIGLDQGVPFVNVVNGAANARSAAVPALQPATWHHIAVTVGTQVTLYVDGRVAANFAATLPALSGSATLGGETRPGQPPAMGFVGDLDEIEIAKVERSAAFIGAAVAAQGMDAKLVVYGEDEENASWDGGYFGTILRQVTIDGWVVIGLLTVMAAISWVVMATKARDISRIARANRQFLESFSRADFDVARFMSQLSEKEASKLDPSVLYRIAYAGSEELAKRLASNRSAHLVLTDQAIATVRANLDRVIAYEGQRLNARMVLLTIAISGGPFLGLLGTVVGVMITFAAIAATGDVNINAIAPGIAAALVATVVGLGVAIPALFGYNYLITRIKDIVTEMHVFADEFVTRLAESYPQDYEPKRLAAE